MVGGGVGYLLKGLVDIIFARYKRAQAEKDQQETREQRLIQERAAWQEHAYAVRARALEGGIKLEDLPPLPVSMKEDDG